MENVDDETLNLELKTIRNREFQIVKELNKRKIHNFFSTHVQYDNSISHKHLPISDKDDREKIVKDLEILYKENDVLFSLRDISKPQILYDILIEADNVFFLYEFVNVKVPEWFKEKYDN